MNKPHAEAYDFLKKHKFAILSTASKDASPWGAAIYYTVDKDLHFYFLTHTASKKYKNIQEHPQAAITVVDDNAQTTVQAAGKIKEVPMGDEQNEAYRMIIEIHPPGEYKWTPPVSKLHNGDTMLLRFTPDHLQLSVFTPSQSTPNIKKII